MVICQNLKEVLTILDTAADDGVIIAETARIDRFFLERVSSALTQNTTLKTIDFTINSATNNNNNNNNNNDNMNHLGTLGAEILSDVFAYNTALVNVILDNNKLGRIGTFILASSLKTNACTNITTLKLANNQIGRKGYKALCELLETNNTITHLDVSSNRICITSCNQFVQVLQANRVLKFLNLSLTRMNNVMVETLSEALLYNTTLVGLDLSSNHFGHKSSNAKKNGQLSSEAEKLSQSLIRNTTLTYLNLSHNNFTLVGAEHLATMLEKNYSLTTLLLRDLEMKGFRRIVQAVKVNKTLTTIDLNSILIDFDSAFELLHAFNFNNTLTSLPLNFQSHSHSGRQATSTPYLQHQHGLLMIQSGLNDKVKRNINRIITMYTKDIYSLHDICCLEHCHWLHLSQNLGISEKEISAIITRATIKIKREMIDLILQRLIPTENNFFPSIITEKIAKLSSLNGNLFFYRPYLSQLRYYKASGKVEY